MTLYHDVFDIAASSSTWLEFMGGSGGEGSIVGEVEIDVDGIESICDLRVGLVREGCIKPMHPSSWMRSQPSPDGGVITPPALP